MAARSCGRGGRTEQQDAAASPPPQLGLPSSSPECGLRDVPLPARVMVVPRRGGGGSRAPPPATPKHGGGGSSAGAAGSSGSGSATTHFELAQQLRAAVRAGDSGGVQRLLQHKLAPHMDDRSAAFVVRSAVEQHSAPALDLLLRQPAVRAMGARAVAGLLQTAVQCKHVDAVPKLAALAEAQNINTAYLSFLLGQAVSLGDARAVQALSALQGNQTELEQLLPAGSMAGALRSAVVQGRQKMVFTLIEHDDLQDLDAASMADILHASVSARSGVITRYLCWLRAAQRLPPATVCGLLEAALGLRDAEAVCYLAEELPGARRLSGRQVARLLQAALQQPDSTIFCRLSQLPPAQGLQPAQILAILRAALAGEAACGTADVVCTVCELIDGARRIDAAALLELLRVALLRHDAATVGHLCCLPAAQQLASGDCLELLQLAAAQRPRLAAAAAASDAASDGDGASACESAGCCDTSSSCSSSDAGGPGDGISSDACSTDGCGSVSSSSFSSSFASSLGSSLASSASSGASSSQLVGLLCRQLKGARSLGHRALRRALDAGADRRAIATAAAAGTATMAAVAALLEEAEG